MLSSYAIYIARDCVHWNSNKPLLQVASADNREESAVNVHSSLSTEQIERIQANKAKALAILKRRAVSNLPDDGPPRVSSADKKVKERSVSWADTSGGKLTEVRSYMPKTSDHADSNDKSLSPASNACTLTWEHTQSFSDYDLEEAQKEEWIESPPSPGW